MNTRLLILCLVSALAVGCVMKDDILVLDERIFRLEQRQQELENRLANIADADARFESKLDENRSGMQEQTQSLRSQLAGFRVETTQLREDLQEITGRVEETEFRLRQRSEGGKQAGERLDSRMDKINSATDENTRRIQQLEQYLSLDAQRQQAAPSPSSPSPKSPPEPGADALYAGARKSFDEGNLTEARESFQQLLERFPDSAQADNAQFWIGETYYREKWYEKAILEYQKVIETYPEGNKLPAALLKQGFAFIELGDTANARLILKELVRKFPESNEAKIAEDKLKTL
jgi:tol-pal system protein YbgF